MTNAAITPGTQPHKVNKKTITIEPHPFPITDNGGKKMASNTLSKLITFLNSVLVQRLKFSFVT